MQAPDTAAIVFQTELGWMALAGRGRQLLSLSIGHASPSAARTHLPPGASTAQPAAPWLRRLAGRLERYAEGAMEDFNDVALAFSPQSAFARRVVDQCREIAYGETLTYGELAAQAGSVGAARAVGNVMATNRYPLIVPCHRVVGAEGKLGGFSAPQGIALKRRLLEMEQTVATSGHWAAVPR